MPRLAAGAYILNSGLSKAKADPQTAAGLHGMAAGAYPFLGKHVPVAFVRLLSRAEIAVGATMLEPGDQVLAILEPGKEDELRKLMLKR